VYAKASPSKRAETKSHSALKEGPGKQVCGRRRHRVSRRLPIAPAELVPNAQQAPAAAEGPKDPAAEAAAREPMCFGFGAVRVGALLGRLRLHLQTDRFLAVHRGDTIWERGCVGAALELAVIVAGMQEAELDAPLTLSGAASSRSGGTLRRTITPVVRGGESESRYASALGTRDLLAPWAAFGAGLQQGAR
jgi:hypothetical protein